MASDLDISELTRITELVWDKHGYDFRNYAMSSFRRRMVRILNMKNLTLDMLLNKIERQPMFIHEFVEELTVNVTELFRDAAFWKCMRDEVIPALHAAKGKFRIWHAGCSSGEEVLSMSILLHEMNLQGQATILATDIDGAILAEARARMVSEAKLGEHEQNYRTFGGNRSLDTYLIREGDTITYRPDLLDQVAFQKHDLVTSATEQTFDLILCRNVMIYFNQALQNDVLKKFHKNLEMNGYLAIGSKESLIWCDVANKFSCLRQEEKIYQKVKA